MLTKPYRSEEEIHEAYEEFVNQIKSDTTMSASEINDLLNAAAIARDNAIHQLRQRG